MAMVRFTMRATQPVRVIAGVLAVLVATYVSMLLGEDDPVIRALLVGCVLICGLMALALARTDRNYRSGQIVFEIDDDSVMIMKPPVRPRPYRVAFADLKVVTIQRRGENLSVSLQPRRGARIRVRLLDAQAREQVLSRIPANIPIVGVDVPGARVVRDS